jgi:hypothetical protein
VVLPDGVHNLRGYVKPPSADVVAAFKEGGKFHKVKSGLYLSVRVTRRHASNSALAVFAAAFSKRHV